MEDYAGYSTAGLKIPAGPAGRTRAWTGALDRGSEWEFECDVEIEWPRHWLPTPHLGGLGAGPGGGLGH